MSLIGFGNFSVRAHGMNSGYSFSGEPSDNNPKMRLGEKVKSEGTKYRPFSTSKDAKDYFVYGEKVRKLAKVSLARDFIENRDKRLNKGGFCL